jgi:D-alanyl-D-alanine endopeptidase (penicillin-binding protein 7)
MHRIAYISVFLTILYSGVSISADIKPVPITATSWLVADGDGNIIESENVRQQRSIASITKLMAAIVILDAQQDLDEYIKPYTRKELLQLSLVRSDNNAATSLCKNYPGGYESCVAAMNRKARSLGMKNTRFTDPTGLGVMNISTAEDLIKMTLAASTYAVIREASKTSEVKIKIRKKWLVFRNTNPIIGKRHDFIVSKTGWIRASGGCIVMMLDTDVGRKIVVVLGSKNTHTRIPEAEFIATAF